MMKVVLIVESEFLHIRTPRVGNAVERLADALSQQKCYRH